MRDSRMGVMAAPLSAIHPSHPLSHLAHQRPPPSSISLLSIPYPPPPLRFSEHPSTRLGLVQKEGGPCGVLAPIQALLLKHLLFGGEGGEAEGGGEGETGRGASGGGGSGAPVELLDSFTAVQSRR